MFDLLSQGLSQAPFLNFECPSQSPCLFYELMNRKFKDSLFFYIDNVYIII